MCLLIAAWLAFTFVRPTVLAPHAGTLTAIAVPLSVWTCWVPFCPGWRLCHQEDRKNHGSRCGQAERRHADLPSVVPALQADADVPLVQEVLASAPSLANYLGEASQAHFDGLKRLRRPEDVARARGKSIKDVLPFRPSAEPVNEESAEAAEPAAVSQEAEAPGTGGDES